MSVNAMSINWWKTYFDKNYLAMYEKSGMFKHTQKEVNFLIKNLPIKKNQKILDLCCGHGRHALILAKKGFRVVGLDYSAYQIKAAKTAAAQAGLGQKNDDSGKKSLNL